MKQKKKKKHHTSLFLLLWCCGFDWTQVRVVCCEFFLFVSCVICSSRRSRVPAKGTVRGDNERGGGKATGMENEKDNTGKTKREEEERKSW